MLGRKEVKSVLNKHKKRDDWFLDDYSVNPYEGCSCNCLYCYIRGSKYGENMEEGLVVKSNALDILEKQLSLRARKNQYGFVAVGSGTDAYIHHEEREQQTLGMLKLLLKYRFPVFISTKCSLIIRDVELLKEISKIAVVPDDLKDRVQGVILSASVSTLNEKISHTLEPGADPPLQRLALVKRLKQEGFLAGVNAIPVLPFISDTEEELEKIILAAKAYEADFILVGGLTLFGSEPHSSKTLFYKFLERYDPLLLPKYQQLYGTGSYTPFSYQRQLKEKADRLCKKHDLRTGILK